MNFGLDYDGTVTAAPALWNDWAREAISRGHKVYLVTMRYPSELEDIPKALLESVSGVYATGRLAKRKFMCAQNINIHVWIDDHPEAVVLDAKDIWADPAPEGQPVVPNYE